MRSILRSFTRAGGLSALVMAVLLTACSREDQQYLPTPMPLVVPSNFPQPVYNLSANPITKEGFALGRKLFYDGRLSRDGSISCGNCHIQSSAFTHHGHAVSHGIDDKVGTRNAPPVMNLAWQPFFLWDGGVFDLDLFPLAPIENPLEMDEHMPVVLDKLRQDADYLHLFNKAFGTPEITTANTLKALSQFMLQCVSANSRYDQYVRREGVSLTTDELAGQQLFAQHCSGCHSTDLFTDNAFHNNGLIPSLKDDKGRQRITLNAADAYRFKTPSLRNVALTPPYMHDGRFRTLEAVLEHYNSGVVASPTLAPLLQQNGQPGIPLTASEQKQIISFLQTLTDEAFIRNPLLSEQ